LDPRFTQVINQSL